MNKLKECRKKIDMIDKGIVELLLLRFGLAGQIAGYKKKNKVKIIDKKREMEIIKNIKKYSNKSNEEFIIKIFKDITNYSKRLQK